MSTTLTFEEIKQLETDPTFIQTHIGKSAIGKNQLIYLPGIIAFGLIFFIAFIVFDGLIEAVGKTIILILSVVAILCIIIVIMMYNSAKKKLKTETQLPPICVAQKVYGNDRINGYFCIYTTGKQRHNPEFINKITEKIIAVPTNTTDKTEKQILRLFQAEFENQGKFANQLPLSFTEGEPVYKKQYSLGRLSAEQQDEIENNNRQFWVVAINPLYGILLDFQVRKNQN